MAFDLIDIPRKRAALAPDATAFIDLASSARRTYRELDERSARFAGCLAAAGVAPQDRVAILCRNRIEFFEVLFACAKLGAILVPLNWRAPIAELLPLVAHSAPRLLIHGREDAAVAHSLGLPCLGLDDPGTEGAEARLRASERHPGREFCPGDQPWYLLYTSGTTGTPKAVIQTYQMALVNYVNASQAFGVCGTDTTLNYLPLFHTAGINLLTLPTLIAGGTALVLPNFDAEKVLRLLGDGRLDTFFAVPAVYQQLSLLPAFANADLTHVRSWACGGAPMSDALFSSYAQKGICVRNGFGMTETGPTAFVASEEEARTKIGSVGRAQILLETRIVGADKRDVAAGEIGEVWMRGPGVTPGYWNNPEATKSAFSDGWLMSGDLARRDADGSHYVAGRIKDMYISGGENVYAAEVENVLAGHPAILEAAVVGIPDQKWGEVGCAYLQLRPRAPKPADEDLTRHCRARLAAYKVPRAFVVVSDFPRTAAGKVRKHLLSATTPSNGPNFSSAPEISGDVG